MLYIHWIYLSITLEMEIILIYMICKETKKLISIEIIRDFYAVK